MTAPVESFAEVATRRDPAQPLIPDTANPHTAIDYKTLIATSLGFEDRRYTGSLSRPLTERLYIVFFSELPDQSKNLNELKYEIANEIGSENPDRLLDARNAAYKREELVDIYEALKTHTHGDVKETISQFDLCPVCDTPVDGRKRVENAGQIPAPDEYKLCLYLGENSTEIVVVEHLTQS